MLLNSLDTRVDSLNDIAPSDDTTGRTTAPAAPPAADHIADARRIIRDAIAAHPHDLAIVSSFGADAVALLHLAAEIDPTVPVIFVDTGRHFAETLAYVADVQARLGLTDLRSVGPDGETIARIDPDAVRFGYDPDGCCHVRKVEPLARALLPFKAWISGRKRFQGETRATVTPVEEVDGRTKYNPLVAWSATEIRDYCRAHDLPRHPLLAQGYPSIGCQPCTSPVKPGEDPRAGRWRGQEKTECGIHLPGVVHDGAGI